MEQYLRMNKLRDRDEKNRRGCVNMKILAKGKPNIRIRQERAKEFIEECNKNVISEPFIETCRQASKLFRKKI